MKPSTLSRFDLRGAAGNIEVKLNDPGADRRGIALIAHPHPLQTAPRLWAPWAADDTRLQPYPLCAGP
jgi:hypothetical protein